jgi:hypothetical protein
LNKRFFRLEAFRRPAPLRARAVGFAVAEAAAIAADARKSMHDPPLEPRDEAVFLLTAAAEVDKGHGFSSRYIS